MYSSLLKTAGLIALILIFLFAPASHSQERFSSLVGPVDVKPCDPGPPLRVPYITWGGDMATFYANGGLKTAEGSIFKSLGVDINLTPGDDFVQQVRDYMSGRTPFLRGTFRMMGMASEVMGSNPATKGMVIMQMTWSAGDHMVARADIRTIADLKGRKIALQKGGPHVGMLDDILKTAGLGWKDIQPVWLKDLTGTPASPAETFRKDSTIGCCMVISPDMIGLTGGLQSSGTGAEGTVKGSRVLVSTAELSRSIADVYVCRKDFFESNRELVTKFVAGYLKACEEVIDLKTAFERQGSEKYMSLLKMTQEIYGKETIPTLEEDAHGLLCDCTFVGHPGNVAFFGDTGGMHGFEHFSTAALDLAVNQGYAGVRNALIPSAIDFNAPVFTNNLKKLNATRGERFVAEAVLKEIEELGAGGQIDERTIYSFTINFDPNQNSFSAEQYGVEFDKVIKMADKYGNAVIAIRGHSDPTKTLLELVKAGLSKGVLKKTGSSGNFKYSFKGRPLDLTSPEEVADAIRSGDFDGDPQYNPRQVMQAALNLSKTRAVAVMESILGFAKSNNIRIDPSQIQPVGVGIREPFIAKPASMDEARQNMRVEFRLMRVSAEVAKPSDFDF